MTQVWTHIRAWIDREAWFGRTARIVSFGWDFVRPYQGEGGAHFRGPPLWCSDWKDRDGFTLLPEGPDPTVVSGCPGLDSAKRSSLPDLAAGHLQGPARIVTRRLDHLLSLVWPE